MMAPLASLEVAVADTDRHECLLLPRGVLNEQVATQGLDFRGLITAWVHLMASRYDVVACMDGANRFMTGPVGLGKSNNALILATCLGHELEHHLGADPWNPYEDLVIRDDLPGWQAALYRRRPYQVIVADEAEWFLFKQWWQKPEIKRLTPEFMSNRKETRCYLLVLPRMDGLVEFFRNDRAGFRLLCTDRGVMEVHATTGHFDWTKGWWGRIAGGVSGLPATPPWLWDVYETRVDAHATLERATAEHMQVCQDGKKCRQEVGCVSFLY